MRIPRNYRNAALNASKAKARELREAIRTARTGPCLIPLNEEDGPCSPELNNCHLIGINHLKPIAKNGHVYEWDMIQIPSVTNNWIFHGTLSEDLTQNSFGEIHPADINIQKCTRRAVCKTHDGPVFRVADRLDLDTEAPEHQFKMGFRAIAGSLALLESLIDFTKGISGEAWLNEFWVSKGLAGDVERHLDNGRHILERRARGIQKELARWQELYLAKDQRESRIISSVGTMTPMIRVACSSIYYPRPGKGVALNIIPAQTGRKATIVVTTRKSKSIVEHFRGHGGQKSALSGIRDQIKLLFEEDPETAIVQLAQNTLHFLVSKEDFDNPNILTETQRHTIAVSMANTLHVEN